MPATNALSPSVALPVTRYAQQQDRSFDPGRIADELYRAGEGRLGVDAQRFQDLLSGRTREQIKAIDQVYQSRRGHGLTAAVQNEMRGEKLDYTLGLAQGAFAPQARFSAATPEETSAPQNWQGLGRAIKQEQAALKSLGEKIDSGSVFTDWLHSPTTLNRLRLSGKTYLESLYNLAAQQFNQQDYQAAKETLRLGRQYEMALIDIIRAHFDRSIRRLQISERVVETILAVDLAIGAGALAIATGGAAAPVLAKAGLSGIALGSAKVGLGIAAGTVFETALRGGGFLFGEALQGALGNGFDGKRVLKETATGAKNGVVDSSVGIVAGYVAKSSTVVSAAFQHLGTSKGVAAYLAQRTSDLAVGGFGGGARAFVNGQNVWQGVKRGALFSAAAGVVLDSTARAYDGIRSHFREQSANATSASTSPDTQGGVPGTDHSAAQSPTETPSASIAPAPASQPAPAAVTAKAPMTLERREEILQALVEKLQTTGGTKVLSYEQLIDTVKDAKVVVLGGYSGLGYQHPQAVDEVLSKIVREHGDNTVYVIGATADGIGRGYDTIPKLAAALGFKNVKTAGIVSKNAAQYGVAPQDYVVFVDTSLNDWEVKRSGLSLMVDIAKKVAGKMIYMRGGGVAKAEIDEALQRQVPVDLAVDEQLIPDQTVLAKKLAKDPSLVVDGTQGFVTEAEKFPTLQLRRFLRSEK